MLELLNTFKTGETYDNALLQVYGFDIDGLDTRWRVHVKSIYQKSVKAAWAPIPQYTELAGSPA